jgi:bifunctional DNase/RNase
MRALAPMLMLCVLTACEGEPALETAEHGAITHGLVSATPPDGYVRMNPVARSGSFGNAVLLVDVDEQIIIPIYIGGTEALSIQLRLSARPFIRPLTHDLFDAFAMRVGAKMVRAQVDRLADNVYIGSVVFKQGEQLIQLDARPSDAIALAIGNDVPVFVSKSVLDVAGVRTEDLDETKVQQRVDPVAL